MTSHMMFRPVRDPLLKHTRKQANSKTNVAHSKSNIKTGTIKVTGHCGWGVQHLI